MKMVQDAVPAVTAGGIKETKKFELKASREAFRILSSGMYKDPVKAIIRELSCNAWDSHVVAGNSNLAFDISLPGRFSPLFRIRDYGTGLSHEQVMNLYVTYFDSTKTEDNTQVGALGIGSKSPLGYTNSFSVVSIQDGVKRIYSVFIGDDDSENPGFPGIAFTGEVPTEEANGIEISVPSQENDFYKWSDAAEAVFKWFPVQPNFAEGTELDIPEVEVTRKVGKVSITKMSGYYYNTSWKVVQGNIAYPLDLDMLGEHYKDLYNSMSGFITVNIGDVMMAPNRESLTYSKQTVKSVTEALDVFEAEFVDAMMKEIDEATSYKVASRLYKEIDGSDFLKKSKIVKEAISEKIKELIDWMLDDATDEKDIAIGDIDEPMNGRFTIGGFNPIYSNCRNLWTSRAIARIYQLAANEGLHKSVDDSQIVVFGVESAGYGSSKAHKIERMVRNYSMAGSQQYTKWDNIYVVYNDGTRSAKSTFARHLREEEDYEDNSVVFYFNKNTSLKGINAFVNYLKKHVDGFTKDNVSKISDLDMETGATAYGGSGGGKKVPKAARLYKTTKSAGWGSSTDVIKWDKGRILQPLIDDDSINYYWFTVKNTDALDLDGSCPKHFLGKMNRVAQLQEIYGVKEADVHLIEDLDNWVHVNESLSTIVGERLTSEKLEIYIRQDVLSNFKTWRKEIVVSRLLDTIEHKGFKELVGNPIDGMEYDERYAMSTLIDFAKNNKIDVKDIYTEPLENAIKELYNSVIGIKVIIEGNVSPNKERALDLIKLVNHFTE